jgi:heme/copper-type cytochrome/quinol oxidase subunit 3
VIAQTRRPLVLTNTNLVGMIVFIASESVFFLALVVAYIANRDAGLPDARAHLELGRTAIFSVALFASSGTMALAASRRDLRWVIATAALGVVFLVGQGTEYLRLLRDGVGPGSALFGTTFFTLTGLHGLHVLVGLVALSALALAARRRRLSRVAWEGVSLYWHFVDVVWVVVFSVVYLGLLL